MFLASASGAIKGPQLKRDEYRRRIDSFHNALAAESIAVIVSNPIQKKSNDVPFHYRQASDVSYLTGFPEPAIVVIAKLSSAPQTKFLMFVRPRNPMEEKWTGKREGLEGAKSTYLADEAYELDKFETTLAALLKQAETVYYRLGINADFDQKFLRVFVTAEGSDQKPLLDPLSILHNQRVIKSKSEIEMLRHTVGLTARTYRDAIRQTKPGMTEKQVEGLFEGLYRWYGADRAAFTPLCPSGENTTNVHYFANSSTINDGDMLVVDSGCEYNGYNSDLCRTWPANGKFSPAQKRVYLCVLAANRKVLSAVRPGVPLADLHALGVQELEHQLVARGILAANSGINVGEFLIHSVLHYLGMDVHDAGKHRDGFGRLTRRPLEENMVLAIEPALHFDKQDTRIAPEYRGMAVRIEDNVVVTAHGCTILSRKIPKSVKAIEALMAEGR